MIRFRLALAGVLIVPALAPAEDPKPSGPPSAVDSGQLLEKGRTYLESELIPIGGYTVTRPVPEGATFPVRKPTRSSPDDRLQANFGLQLAPADDALRAQLEIAPGRGVVVVAVQPGGLAEQAGLKPNDVLTRLGERDVDGIESATKALLGLGKEAMEVKLIREGKPSRMSLVGPEHGFPPEAAEFWIGVPVSPVDATLRSHLPALESDLGLVANDVVKDSPADAGGLRKNDILMTMGGKPLKNADSLIEQIQASRGKPTPLEILRGGKEITVSVTPARRAHPTTINLPGARWKMSSYYVAGPQVAVEVDPNVFPVDPANQNRAQPGPARVRDREILNWSLTGANPSFVYPDMRYDAIVVNPYRVDGAELAGPSERPRDIHLRMAPRPEVRPDDATARIEARLIEISARLEELRKAVDGLRKAEGR